MSLLTNMATTRFYLDDRRSKSDKQIVLKIAISHQNTSAYISLEAKLFSNQWDNKRLKVVNHPDDYLLNVCNYKIKNQNGSFILYLANGELTS